MIPILNNISIFLLAATFWPPIRRIKLHIIITLHSAGFIRPSRERLYRYSISKPKKA